MLLDANILLYATDIESPYHERSRRWLEGALNGSRRVAIPWGSISAFLRISTNPRSMENPLTPKEAWSVVEAWLAADPVWTPNPGPSHASILGELITRMDLRGNLVSDAAVAALCIEYGLDVVSADSDFARFSELKWVNPLIEN